MKRWWFYRRAHRMFGLKFWAMVVGAAPLDPDVEAFWGRLGFLVVQGYGLTETAPIVTLNHPFHAARGAVGKPIGGVEVRIADDGEILVRGENVTTGYFNAPEETRSAFRDGWFHTGDIGGFDDQGRLYIRGRKKEMIVTPEGLNVFPEDVERAINDQPGVRDSAVVGAPVAGGSAERVQAIVVLAGGADLDDVVRGANARLQDHQKIRLATVWPGEELPRTEGTRKLKRRELRDWLVRSAGAARGDAPAPAAGSDRSVRAVVQRFAPGRIRRRRDDDRRARFELARARRADDGARRSAAGHGRRGQVRRGPDRRRSRSAGPPARRRSRRRVVGSRRADRLPFLEPHRCRRGRCGARACPTWILPLGRVFARVKVEGLEHLRDLVDAGDLRREPPEPPRYAGDPRRSPRPLALPGRAGDGEGVLQGALLSGAVQP